MFLKNKRLIAIFALASFSQVACYNTYFIDKGELEKLESEVEQKEVVDVQGDCDDSKTASQEADDGDKQAHVYDSAKLDGTKWAQAGELDEMKEEVEGGDETASDATGAEEAPAEDEESGDEESSAREGCSEVPVSTANPVTVRTKNGETYRVTPFNFMMSEQQLVSPEYDLLLSLDEVEGGEVQEFSPWKTAGAVAGVSAVTVGTIVGISILAPEADFGQ